MICCFKKAQIQKKSWHEGKLNLSNFVHIWVNDMGHIS
jgi:hypothetical protein